MLGNETFFILHWRAEATAPSPLCARAACQARNARGVWMRRRAVCTIIRLRLEQAECGDGATCCSPPPLLPLIGMMAVRRGAEDSLRTHGEGEMSVVVNVALSVSRCLNCAPDASSRCTSRR